MNLDELRNEINVIDCKMVDLFLKRLKLCREIGKFKRDNNLPILNEKREQEIIDKLSVIDGANAGYVKMLFEEIFSICKEVQK